MVFIPVVSQAYIIRKLILTLFLKGMGIFKSFGSRPIISNNTVIVYDIASSGIVLVDSDSASVFNNVVISKSDDIGHGIRNAGVQNLQANNNYIIGPYRFSAISTGDQSVLKNNVITNSDIGVEIFSDYNILIQYNNSWNNDVNYIGFTPDSTNLEVDPMVINDDSTKGDLDFHLQKYSPLIDAGDPNILDRMEAEVTLVSMAVLTVGVTRIMI
ncbi:MAG: right-handed parallel beta-helix repeat-containing protein [Ignavibacteriales bacterium]|nr:right-handed parallel beta-helix repeat-containing protein [Ignavibacteriales bacterium]